jgi:hypothetical protein
VYPLRLQQVVGTWLARISSLAAYSPSTLPSLRGVGTTGVAVAVFCDGLESAAHPGFLDLMAPGPERFDERRRKATLLQQRRAVQRAEVGQIDRRLWRKAPSSSVA